MKVFAFLFALALFVGGLLLFGYAFAVGDGWNMALFGGGMVAISAALAIPFHLLEKFD
ncbi:MAG TPA: hypothetical protein VNR36_01430 [Pseudolysinimonas sp.]|nr:hypothetical protein [Pseudolysinimonas sp.]